ncbi:MAG: ABC transporter permease, partial [Caulobacterales bacterium]
MPDTSSSRDAIEAGLSGPVPPQPRTIGAVNWLGLWTLYKKEVRRFLKVSFQTVMAPVATTLLYMMVFSLAVGATREAPGGLPFAVFLAPGLIMMGLLNNAFANSSSSLIVAKVQGNTVDFLMPPLSAGELAAAFIGGAITRGVLVAAASAIVIVPFASLPLAHPWAIVFFGVGAAA